jgi:hypothetical protein
MEGISRPILWEVVRYDPWVLFALEAVCKANHAKLERDLTYFYYYFEENYQLDALRK